MTSHIEGDRPIGQAPYLERVERLIFVRIHLEVENPTDTIEFGRWTYGSRAEPRFYLEEGDMRLTLGCKVEVTIGQSDGTITPYLFRFVESSTPKEPARINIQYGDEVVELKPGDPVDTEMTMIKGRKASMNALSTYPLKLGPLTIVRKLGAKDQKPT